MKPNLCWVSKRKSYLLLTFAKTNTILTRSWKGIMQTEPQSLTALENLPIWWGINNSCDTAEWSSTVYYRENGGCKYNLSRTTDICNSATDPPPPHWTRRGRGQTMTSTPPMTTTATRRRTTAPWRRSTATTTLSAKGLTKSLFQTLYPNHLNLKFDISERKLRFLIFRIFFPFWKSRINFFHRLRIKNLKSSFYNHSVI